MEEVKYLELFISPHDMNPNIQKIILWKLKEKNLYKEIYGKMFTNIEITDFNKITLSKSSINNLELNIPLKIDYKIYKPGDIIEEEIFADDNDKRAFVISHDIICEIENIKNHNHLTNNVRVILTSIKSTSGCSYFLAKGYII